MTYVVTEACIKCKYTDCVDVCPVDCFREGPNFLVIDPDECIDCTLCVAYCPSQAITGLEWSRSSPFVELVKLSACRSHKAGKRATDGKPNCGLCINICPYGRRGESQEGLLRQEKNIFAAKTQSAPR